MRGVRVGLALIALAMMLFGGDETIARAQKLIDAPSEVMLTKNIQRQTVNASAIAAQNSSAGPLPLPSQAQLKKTSEASQVISVPDRLTIADAQRIAIANNPRIRVGQLLARAQHQVFRETRSVYLPHLEGGAVAAGAGDGSRFSFDDLRTTRLITHVGGGLDFHQLITDFGHTSNLIAASRLYEKAQNSSAQASQLDVVLIVDQAFYNTLEAQALVKVAQQTVDTRDTTNRQITVLTKNKLRSDVDLAFAEENLAQARLLLLDAQTQYRSDLNALTSVMGFDRPMHYTLVDDTTNVPLPPPDADSLVQTALQQRPDLMALDYDQQAAKKYSRAEWEQLLPTLGARGVVGGTPIRDRQYFTTSWFGAIGGTLKVPIFNGFLYTSQAKEADDRAKAAQENQRDLRDRIVRDVRNAWLQANESYQKIAVTQKFLQAANLGLNLAQSRYKLGLSSIVELSQSQLAQTQASIENVNAKFEYQLSLAALNYQLGNLP